MHKLLDILEKIAISYQEYKKLHPKTKKTQSDPTFSAEHVAKHITSVTPKENAPSWLYDSHVQGLKSHGEKWVKKKIPLNSITHKDIHSQGEDYDRDKVDRYEKMYRDNPDAPPIVVGKHGSVHDGVHRATAAKRAGLTHIDAYVPVGGKHHP